MMTHQENKKKHAELSEPNWKVKINMRTGVEFLFWKTFNASRGEDIYIYFQFSFWNELWHKKLTMENRGKKSNFKSSLKTNGTYNCFQPKVYLMFNSVGLILLSFQTLK